MPQIGSVRAGPVVPPRPDKRRCRPRSRSRRSSTRSVFIVGPTLVTVLATVVHPLAGLVTAARRRRGRHGGVRLPAAHRAARVRRGRRSAAAGAMPWAMLVPLVVCAFAMGVLLGGAEVATVAFAEEQGDKALAGLLLAIWALGSLLSGVITGAARITLSNATRFRWGLLALGRADGAAAVRERLLAAGGVPVPGRLRDLPDADRQLRVDRGDGARRPADRGHDAVHHRAGARASRRAPRSSAWSSTRPVRPRASGCRWSPGSSAPPWRFAGRRAQRGRRAIAHRIVRVSAAPVARTSDPLGHRQVGQPQLAACPQPASARPPTPPVRRTAPARAAAAAG